MLHEEYIRKVVALATARLSKEDRAKLAGIKVAYGAGSPGTRGITFYSKWKNGTGDPLPFVEICAFGEESTLQLCGTTLHELGHVLAGMGNGHGSVWHECCARLGLTGISAAGTVYAWDMIEEGLRKKLKALKAPDDGAPCEPLMNRFGRTVAVKGCTAGVGTKGGKSRGPGSGSRLIKVLCGECGYTARVSQKWIDKPGPPHCPVHGAMDVFKRS